MLTQEQFDDFCSRYLNLCRTISSKISGDTATVSKEDNLQELFLTAIQTAETFARLNGFDNYDDFKDDAGWNKYVKTALWNNKNSRGKKISQKYAITRDTVPTFGNEDVLQMTDDSPSCLDTQLYLEDLATFLDFDEMTVVRTVLNNACYIKPNGKINRLALGEDLRMTWGQVDRILNTLSEKLFNDF